MRIQAVDNQCFGKIILRDNRVIPSNILHQAQEATNGKFHAEELEGRRLINEVIKNDYNTPALWSTYKNLVESQENNPVNIYLDLFLPDEEIPLFASGWFQKATVRNKTFKQRTTYFAGIEKQPSPIKFLERACRYANFLKFFEKN